MKGVNLLGEFMADELMQCFVKTKKSLKENNKDWSPKRVDRVARAICVKQTGQSFVKHSASVDSMFDVSLSESGEIKDISFIFNTDIEVLEKAKLDEIRPTYEIRDPDSKLVVGRALFETTSKNFNRYEEKEIKKAVKTFPGVTCQVDHSDSARDTFGIVQESWWDTRTSPKEMAYIAELEGSDPFTAKVVKGYLRGVSVKSGAKSVECSICGEQWSFMHEHWPGEKYDGKVCERIPRGIYFKHLGFTPIPALDADTEYVAASISEAFDNATVYMDYKFKGKRQQISNVSVADNKIGEIQMSESDSEQAKALREAEKAKYELAEAQRKIEELSEQSKQQSDILKENERLKSETKSRLVDDIIEKELALKKIEDKNIEERKKELTNESNTVLKAKLDVLKEWYSNMDHSDSNRTPEAGSKSKNFGVNSPFSELDEGKKEKYLKEAKSSQLAKGLFGRNPSITAVETLDGFDQTRGRWNTDLAELFRAVPKR